MEETLKIELEDAASRSWWARILYTLGSQYGRTQLRLVGKTDGGRRLYISDTFPAPSPGPMAPEEEWAPGMEASLADLCRQIARDGWSEVGRGQRLWDRTFTRHTGTGAQGGKA
jgi:hypothetical protein